MLPVVLMVSVEEPARTPFKSSRPPLPMIQVWLAVSVTLAAAVPVMVLVPLVCPSVLSPAALLRVSVKVSQSRIQPPVSVDSSTDLMATDAVSLGWLAVTGPLKTTSSVVLGGTPGIAAPTSQLSFELKSVELAPVQLKVAAWEPAQERNRAIASANFDE